MADKSNIPFVNSDSFMADKNSSVVEWFLRGITTPLGAASYQLQEVYEHTLLERNNRSLRKWFRK